MHRSSLFVALCSAPALWATACGTEPSPQAVPAAADLAQPEPPPDGPVPPSEPGPAPELDPNLRPSIPPADAGGWSEPGRAKASDPCPADMVFVPAGEFMAGATDEEVKINPDWPDIQFRPRPRQPRSTGAYCIDLYEYPNVKGAQPWVYVGWAEAKQACTSRGRRLCGEEEWVKACAGEKGWLYPYGDEHEAGRCNDAVDPVGDESQKAGGGVFERCVSPYGAYDMDGNVSEWVDAFHEVDPERERIVRGGTMWVAVYGHGCMSRHSHHEGGPTHGDDGFRCCMDTLGSVP